ncbi:MAG TPA: hypothetical protein VGR22_07425 [Thermomicrobiales bacterium]|nr:hypothetical protein [Thermomicrobiales bacterium]
MTRIVSRALPQHIGHDENPGVSARVYTLTAALAALGADVARLSA